MKTLKTLLIVLVALILVAFLGCAGFQDAVTPCHIDAEIAEYAEGDMTSYLPFTTLRDAKELKRRMDYIHLCSQEEINRLSQDDFMLYHFLDDSLAIGMADSKQLQDNLFDPAGPGGLLITTLLGGTLGAVLVKRPGDKSKKEVELEKATK